MSDQPVGEIVLYQRDGEPVIEVRLDGETAWLTQAQMVELFQSSKANISEHVKHVFDEGELVEEAVVRRSRTTAADGKSYLVAYYNLGGGTYWKELLDRIRTKYRAQIAAEPSDAEEAYLEAVKGLQREIGGKA
jgi:hypothetical protein